MNILDSQITSRVNKEILNKFRHIASELDKRPQQLLRELIAAVVDDRVKIVPIKHKYHKNIYS